MVSKKRSVKLRESGNLEDLSRESRAVGEGLVFRVWPWYRFIWKKRRPVPVKVLDRLMVANRHTCCICNQPRHPVEKHHINEDPSDNAWSNLALVCRTCHGLVTQKGNLGARYSQGEVLLCKLRWEKRCAEAPVDENESPLGGKQLVIERAHLLARQVRVDEDREVASSRYRGGVKVDDKTPDRLLIAVYCRSALSWSCRTCLAHRSESHADLF
jgi:hypothetical protein